MALVIPAAAAGFAPVAPLTTWAIALLALIGLASAGRWARGRRRRDAWCAAAAVVLAGAHALPFAAHPAAIWRTSRTAPFVEREASARQALRLARGAEGPWVLVGPPEQQLEIDGRGRFYDLARFVARFDGRTGRTAFRFDLGGGPLFVFVEKTAPERGVVAGGLRFLDARPAVYGVPYERARLARRARRLCDAYRRTHSGASIFYDDAELRVYRIEP
jgi:hypothetical protein